MNIIEKYHKFIEQTFIDIEEAKKKPIDESKIIEIYGVKVLKS